jgi:hypothetical protein
MSGEDSTDATEREYSSKEKSLLENDFADPCPNCGAVLFEWEDSCDECDGDEETETEQATLMTDGGVDEHRTTRDERRDERPPFVDPNAEYAVCHFCGQTWEPAAVDGFDLSAKDEYYPKMVPVCPEHAGGCR